MIRMTVEETKSKCFVCSPMGDEGYSAEIKIKWRDMDYKPLQERTPEFEGVDYGTLYIYAESASFVEERYYLVSNESRMEKLIREDVNPEVKEYESYDCLDSALKSKYSVFFKMCDELLDYLESAYNDTASLDIE